MQRYFTLILWVAVLGLPFALRAMLSTDPDSAPSDAGSVRLVIVTPHNQDIRREFARAFDAWHRRHFGIGATIDYRTPGGTNDIKRLLELTYRAQRQAGRAASADIDIAWGGGDYFFDVDLRPAGLLQPLGIDPAVLSAAIPEPTLAGVKLYDFRKDKSGQVEPPAWVGICLSSFGIVYSPDLYRTMGLPAPKRWGDLTHPELAGAVALADPTHSGSAAVAYMMVLQRAMADAEADYFREHPQVASAPKAAWTKAPGYDAAIARGWHDGMGQLLLMAANARYFTDSASQVPNDVSIGDAAAGVAIDFYARVTEESVGSDRVRFVSPAAATAITPDPVGILRGVTGERLLTARRFVEFLLSPEAQRLWILKPGSPGGPLERGLRRPPIRRDVYVDQTHWSDTDNPFQAAGGFNQRAEWMALFGDVRPLWAAAWLDGRESLKSAYATVLAVKDEPTRAALIARLADLPITMADVAAQRAQRKKIEAAGDDIEQWKVQSRMDWAKKFRAHYAAVADAAEAARKAANR